MTDEVAKIGFEVDTAGIEKGEIALKRLAKSGEQVDKSFATGATAAKKTGDSAKQAGEKAEKASDSFGKFADETKQMTAASNSFAGAVGKIGGVIASAFALDKTITTITRFEDSILRLQATSGASADAMATLSAQARELGATSRFSATEAADAQNFLAMAGLKTNEILSSTASVMKFASAAGIDLARSADIATNVLGGMQLPVSQLDRVMNAMVNSAQSANTNINQLGDAFSYAAPLAVTAGISVEQLAAAVGVLGDAGLQGSRGGTAMLGIIRQLSNATPEAEKSLAKYGLSMADVDIKSKGLTGVLKTLQKANLSTADAMKIFGSEAAGAALILAGGVEKVEELTGANEKAAGKLEEVASILDGGLSAAFAGVNSAIEEFMLQTGDNGLGGALKGIAVTTAALISNMNGLLPKFAEANGLSKEFESNIRLTSQVLKVAGIAIGAYGAAILVSGANAKAAAAWNALYSLSLKTVATDATKAAAAVTLIQKSIAVVGAAAAGWSIGTYLREEFEFVEKAGISLAYMIHSAFTVLEGQMAVAGENIKFAFSNPIDFARDKIADFLTWLPSIGAATLGFIGIDTTEIEKNIEAAGAAIRGKSADEHKKAIDQIKANTKKELQTVASGYYELYSEVGKAAAPAKKAVEELGTVTTKTITENKTLGGSFETTAAQAKAAVKAEDELRKTRENLMSSIVKNTNSIRQSNDALKLEIESIGKTKRELVTLERERNRGVITQLKEIEAGLKSVKGRELESAAIREQIDALEERNTLLGQKIDTEEVYESQKKIADRWQSLSDDMGRTFTDAIINGGANAKEAIKRMFANMVLRPIIEPIAQGVANMFTGAISGMFGGGQGGGFGGMLSGMFGSGGGGSFGFGSMRQAGQSIYSAATGFGKAMYTGFSEGGFTGAMQGLGSYFGGITAKIGSWFGGGAASGGVGYGIGQPLVSGGVGSASYAGGSSMFSGMASAWPLAVVMGMIQSGKLYDAGVRPSASEMWKSTEGNLLGQIGNVAATFQSGKFKLIDSALEPIFGGKIAAMISGSTFHQALWGGINKKLFGSGEKYKRHVGSATGTYSDGSYEGTGVDKSWFPGSRKFGADYDNALDQVVALYTSTLGSIYEAFGEEVSVSATARTRIRRTSGRLAADFISNVDGNNTFQTKQYSGDDATDQFARDVLGKHLASAITSSSLPEHFREQFKGLTDNEEITSTLEGIFNRFEGVNAILEITGHAAYELTNAGMILSDQLLDITGGLENLAGASDVYYKNFFSAEEQFENAFAAMEKALDDAGLSAIDSREAYRQAVEGLDLTTESGQEMFATMMLMAGTASEYFSILEDQAIKSEIVADALKSIGFAAEASAKELILLSGGFDALMSGMDAYYQGFFTEAERFDSSLSAMREALSDAGLGAISSREAYREMVEGLDLTTEAGREMFVTMMEMAGLASEYFSVLEGYQNQLAGMSEAINAEPILGYTAVLELLQKDFEQMSAELEAVGLATDENIATLEQFRQKMAEMAALDLFGGGKSMADALRQGLLGTWDGESIGDYLARSISDGVYGAIAGQFANQITDILLQGIVAPMINAALTGAAVSEAVTAQSIQAIVAQAQEVAQVASEVMGALKDSGVMDELKSALGGDFISPPKTSYIIPEWQRPKVDDSWKKLLDSIIRQTERAQQQLADMGRTTYEKGLAGIAATVADYNRQIAQSTGGKGATASALNQLAAAERRLLEAQMDQRAVDILSGVADELARIGKTDAELAIMDIDKQRNEYIKALHDLGRATDENISQIEDWAEAMKELAAKEAKIRAAGDAFDALSRAVDDQRSVITEALELARNVADAAGNAAKSLFADVLGASDANVDAARSFITDAVAAARESGVLPDSDKLRDAIDTATKSFDDAASVSVADSDWQKLVLANQLKELADLAEPQVDYAQEQLDALDAMLENAKNQLDALQGIDNSVMSVADALARFNEIMAGGSGDGSFDSDGGVFEPMIPPENGGSQSAAEEKTSQLVAEVLELRTYMREVVRETKRTADAVNGRGDAPMIVEMV